MDDDQTHLLSHPENGLMKLHIEIPPTLHFDMVHFYMDGHSAVQLLYIFVFSQSQLGQEAEGSALQHCITGQNYSTVGLNCSTVELNARPLLLRLPYYSNVVPGL